MPRDDTRHPFASKLRWALRGVVWALRTQSNFEIHLLAAALVVALAAVMRATLLEWCVLVICIAVVLAAETFNTALEHLARAITREHNEEIRNALDTAGGAVLLTATGAAIAGGIIFINRLGLWFDWWAG